MSSLERFVTHPHRWDHLVDRLGGAPWCPAIRQATIQRLGELGRASIDEVVRDRTLHVLLRCGEAGDEHAANMLLFNHLGVVDRVVRWQRAEAWLAEITDRVQRSFPRVLMRRHATRTVQSVPGLVRRITLFRTKDVLRRRSLTALGLPARIVSLEDLSGDDWSFLEAVDDDVAAAYLADVEEALAYYHHEPDLPEAGRLLADILRLLSASQQRALLGVAFDGEQWKERLAQPSGTSRSHLCRARKTLQRELAARQPVAGSVSESLQAFWALVARLRQR